MADAVPYKFYEFNTNGYPSVQILPGTNTPYSAKEVDYNRYLELANRTGFYDASGNQYATKPSDYGTYGTSYIDYGGTSQYQKDLQNPDIAKVLNAAATGQTISSGLSWGKDPVSGQYGWGNWDIVNADNAAHEAAVAAGTEIKVPIGNGFGYIPSGTAGANLATGLANGSVSPTNPTQQYNASLTGNNVNAPGIVPSAPTATLPGESPEALVNRIQNPTPDNSSNTPATTQDYAFTSQQDFFNKTGKTDYSGVQVINPGQTPTSQYYRYSGNPTVYQRASTPVQTAQTPTTQTPVVQTSASERLKQLRDSLGIGTPPAGPTMSAQDTATLNSAQSDVNAINKELEDILAQRTALNDQMRKFAITTGPGMTEGGRSGAVSEEQRNIQFQLDALNSRELVLNTKLNNRNNTINQIMQTSRQNYQDAVSQYNTQFGQALQLYSIFDKQNTDLQQNAKASLDVLTNNYGNLIQSGKLNINQLTPAQKSQLNDLENQAGLPLNSSLMILQSMKPGEEKLYSGVDNKGTFSYVTRSADGSINVQKVAGVQAPTKTSSGPYNPTPSNPVLPKGYPSASQIDDWLTANKRANPGVAYYDLWGKLADELSNNKINPADFNKEFWKILHPEGLAGYQKYVASQKSGSGIDFNSL